MRIFVVLTALLLWVACDEDSVKTTTPAASEPKVISVDSSAYYDSANAEIVPMIRQFFKSRADNRYFNGAYLVAHNGYIIDTGCYGYTNFTTKDSVNIHTAFQLASVSKPFTAIAIMKLVADGVVGLDDNVKKYIPELPYDGITIGLLLSHRGGLGNYIYFTEYLMKDSTGFLFNESILKIFRDTVPDIYFPPDKTFDYSNTGYALLATVVERATQLPFADWMSAHIFEPFGMTDAFILNKRKPLPKHAALGHLWDYRMPGNDYLNGVIGDKGMYASVYDLFMFDKALNSGKVLPDTLLNLCFSPQNPVKRDSSSYGYGWRLINPHPGNCIVYHTGWWQGFRSYYIKYPSAGKTIIVLDNVKRGPFLGVRDLVTLITTGRTSDIQEEEL